MSETKESVMKELVEKISANDPVSLQELMKLHQIQVDAEDENGMTLLQHAAFKGKLELCQMLLDIVSLSVCQYSTSKKTVFIKSYQGSNPNGGHHKHDYSSLHFAALSGNAQVCQLLLQHNCRIDSVNSVGRTAAQMAAFVGWYYN